MVDFLKNSYIAFLTKEWCTKNLQDANDMQTRETQVRKYIIEFSLYFVANFESWAKHGAQNSNTVIYPSIGHGPRLNFVDRTRGNASCAADSLTRGYLLQVDADEWRQSVAERLSAEN